jgi:hypothetical protein
LISSILISSFLVFGGLWGAGLPARPVHDLPQPNASDLLLCFTLKNERFEP